MRVVIAGSRTIYSMVRLENAIAAAEQRGIVITEVVSGGAKGVDQLGEEWARKHNIPYRVFPANWEKFGKSAGYKRNHQMANYAEAGIILWDGKSSGTKHMLETLKSLDKPGVLSLISHLQRSIR